MPPKAAAPSPSVPTPSSIPPHTFGGSTPAPANAAINFATRSARPTSSTLSASVQAISTPATQGVQDRPATASPFTPLPAAAPALSSSSVSFGQPSLKLKRKSDSEENESRKRMKRDYAATIKVLVGKDAEEFIVHKDLICKASTFFAAACSKEWTEGQTGIIKLPEHSADHFRYYFDWVYSAWLDPKKLELEPCGHTIMEDEGATPEVAELKKKWYRSITLCEILCHLSILADFLGDTSCKAFCMKLLLRPVLPFPNPRLSLQMVVFIAENSTPESGLFRWMIDELAFDYVDVRKTAEHSVAKLNEFPTSVNNAVLMKCLTALRWETGIKSVGSKVAHYLD